MHQSCVCVRAREREREREGSLGCTTLLSFHVWVVGIKKCRWVGGEVTIP